MDDIGLDLLLPGLKVSTGLIRQRPVGPTSNSSRRQKDSAAPRPVGTKRRYDVAWEVEAEGSAVALKKAHATAINRPPRVLRLVPSSPSSSSSRETAEPLPALQQCQAGITTDMLELLSKSPDAAATASFGGRASGYGASSSAIKPKAHSLDSPYMGLQPSPAVHATYPKSASLDGCLSTGLARSGEVFPFVGTSSGDVEARLGQTLSCAGALMSELHAQSCHVAQLNRCQVAEPGGSQVAEPGGSHVAQPETFCSALSASPPKQASLPLTGQEGEGSSNTAVEGGLVTLSPSKLQRGLSRAEKWHERISLATIRRRQNSLISAQVVPDDVTSIITK